MFIWFWWGFLQMILMKNLAIVTVLSIIWVKMITYPVILLCPALYCVQHIIVSNKILCPKKYCVHTYPKVHLFPLHMSTCCGRIMLRLRSTWVVNCWLTFTLCLEHLWSTLFYWGVCFYTGVSFFEFHMNQRIYDTIFIGLSANSMPNSYWPLNFSLKGWSRFSTSLLYWQKFYL